MNISHSILPIKYDIHVPYDLCSEGGMYKKYSKNQQIEILKDQQLLNHTDSKFTNMLPDYG